MRCACSSSDHDKSEGGDGDAEMEDAATAAAAAMAQKFKNPTGPDDLSAYNLDTYDEEESKGAGE